MPLLGKGAVAMWWDMAAEHRAEFEDWHSHEHFRERMGIPGFQRGTRWAGTDGGEGFFVMYELDSYDTLSSPAYHSRLNAPTPWSTAMMPRHRNMVRSQCHVLETHGCGIGNAMLTIRLSPEPQHGSRLQAHLQGLLSELPQRRGLTAAHLLRTQTPPTASTAEQQIRGGADRVADWIVLACGYDATALAGLAAGELGPQALQQAGALPTPNAAVYRLAHAITPQDL